MDLRETTKPYVADRKMIPSVPRFAGLSVRIVGLSESLPLVEDLDGGGLEHGANWSDGEREGHSLRGTHS